MPEIGAMFDAVSVIGLPGYGELSDLAKIELERRSRMRIGTEGPNPVYTASNPLYRVRREQEEIDEPIRSELLQFVNMIASGGGISSL